MPTENTAAEIKSRFDSEQDYILQSVGFVQLRSTLDDGRIAELNHSLRERGLPQLLKRDESRFEEPFSPDEITALLDSIQKVTPAVQKARREYEAEEAGQYRFLTTHGTIDSHGHLYTSWVNHIIAQPFPDEPTQDDLDALRQRYLKEALDAPDRPYRTEPDSEEVLAAVIHDAIDTVMDVKRRAKGGALQHALDQFEELRLIARYATPDAEINLLRRGFILLTTAFDATIFDLMRTKLRKDFFKLIGVFGKTGKQQDKVSLEDFAEAGSFEALRDEIIEEQLKKRYIKDLLFVLEDLDIECVDKIAGDRHIQLIELAQRRNIHVHNRGVVDEKYLEADAKGTPKYNIFNLKFGDAAPIDEAYWEQANRLCKNCVARVAAWAES
jgi:hypothetical protein